MGDVLIIPSPSREGYAELAAPGINQQTGQRYPRFRKHILNLGTLKYQGREYKLDDSWYARLKDNFNSGVSMVQVPLANDENKHVEGPLSNTGEVVGIERDGSKVYSVIEVRKPVVAEGLRDKTIMGASAFLAMDYTDTRTGRKVGPALLHHCLTNRPYVLDLEPYQEIVAATADMEGEDEPVVLATEEAMPTKEELLAQLKAEHGIDVATLQAQAAQRVDTAQLTAILTEALKGSDVKLSATDGSTVSLTDVTGAIVELAGQNKAQGERIAGLERETAETRVDKLIDDGRLLPKSRNVGIEMLLSHRQEDLDAITAPADAPYVKLNHQEGGTQPDGEDKHEQDIDAELTRLTQDHPEIFSPGTAK